MLNNLLGRPCKVVTRGLIKCSWCLSFFLFFRHAFSEFPRPIALKLCHMVGIWPNFIMQVQKLGGHSPKKSRGQKHAKFRSILDHCRLWSRISPERLKISKIADGTNYGNSSYVRWKKSGELWSTNGLEFHVSLDPLKCTFLADYISAHSGCCALKILHALEIDHDYLAHTRSGIGVPPKKF